MKKIQSLYKRDYEGTKQVYDEIVEGSEWVFTDDTAYATVKHDGTSCMIKDKKIYKRYDVKKGRKVPEGAIPCEESANEHTGHWPHWVECDRENNSDKWHFDALDRANNIGLSHIDGTYELCGPKVNGNKQKHINHCLISHSSEVIPLKFNSFTDIKDWLCITDIEGIVWHNSNGDMVKIKRKDFGFNW
jgi:hypothetical protein